MSIFKKKIISNYYKTNYKKTALLSYIKKPFKTLSPKFHHTNYFEAASWGKILSSLGYNVDIIYFNQDIKLDLSKYSLICGFGNVFKWHFEANPEHSVKTICYGTGMHVCHQNTASLSRVRSVYQKTGVWLAGSARFVDKTWTHQTTLVDGIIALGNEVCADSYKKYYDGKVLSVLAPFYKTQDGQAIISQRNKVANKNFLWFGSSGLLHKGLDLLLDYFSKHSNLTLHICGNINNKGLFENTYKKELYETSNIIPHGFIDISSDKFADILKKCAFIIYPSCSEGGSPSVVTAIGNGGLIPIISKETTMSTGYEIWIDEFDYDNIDIAVKKSLALTDNEILNLQQKNYEYVNLHNSQENYYKNLETSIKDILGN